MKVSPRKGYTRSKSNGVSHSYPVPPRYSLPPPIMPDIFAAPTVQAGLAMIVLLVVIVGGIWLLGRLRDYTTQDRPAPQEGFANLEEMLRKGDISEAEFRNIRTSARSQIVSSTPAQSQPVRSPEAPSDLSET